MFRTLMISTVRMSFGEYAGKGGRGGGRGTERGEDRERGEGRGGGGGGAKQVYIIVLAQRFKAVYSCTVISFEGIGNYSEKETNNLNKTKTKAEKEEKS